MIWNTACRPQQNGVIERAQGTGKRWAEPAGCRTPEELQRRVDDADAIHRAEYPLRHGRSRLELFPALRHSGRSYTAEDEPRLWDWDRVADLLKRYTLPRRVDSSGKVTLYKRNHYVGTAYQGWTIYTSFDPLACEWIFRDEHGNQLRTKPAEELTPESIRALTVTDRHGKTS